MAGHFSLKFNGIDAVSVAVVVTMIVDVVIVVVVVVIVDVVIVVVGSSVPQKMMKIFKQQESNFKPSLSLEFFLEKSEILAVKLNEILN